MDITFREKEGTFNFRVCGILIHEGKLLAMHDEKSPYYYLPGGRVQLHEPTEVSVIRELEEELGIPQGSCFPEELFSFNYFSQYEGLSEYEIDHVFLVDYDGPINVDPDEIMDTRWVDLTELQKEMESAPQKFSTWFLIATPRVLEQVLRE